MSGEKYVGAFAAGVLFPKAVGGFLLVIACILLFGVQQCGSALGIEFWQDKPTALEVFDAKAKESGCWEHWNNYEECLKRNNLVSPETAEQRETRLYKQCGEETDVWACYVRVGLR